MPDRQNGSLDAQTLPQLPQFNESVPGFIQLPLQHMELGHWELSLQEPVECAIAVLPAALTELSVLTAPPSDIRPPAFALPPLPIVPPDEIDPPEAIIPPVPVMPTVPARPPATTVDISTQRADAQVNEPLQVLFG